VYVEMLIVTPPLLLLFLGLTQLALVFAAELLVQHAAARAVRAAIVVLPDDAEGADYAGDPLNSVGSGEGLAAYRAAPAGGRLDAIRKAARLTLSPISPSFDSIASGSIADALAGAGTGTTVAGLVGFTAWTVAVTFPDGAGGYLSTFGPRDSVTARVTFLYRCAVPLGRELVCSAYGDLPAPARERIEINGGGVAVAAIASGARFAALEAERTLPNQGR
jgi:Flp pilus assembly protein TadG